MYTYPQVLPSLQEEATKKSTLPLSSAFRQSRQNVGNGYRFRPLQKSIVPSGLLPVRRGLSLPKSQLVPSVVVSRHRHHFYNQNTHIETEYLQMLV